MADPKITYADYHPDDYLFSDQGKSEEPPYLDAEDEAIIDDVNDTIGRETEDAYEEV